MKQAGALKGDFFDMTRAAVCSGGVLLVGHYYLLAESASMVAAGGAAPPLNDPPTATCTLLPPSPPPLESLPLLASREMATFFLQAVINPGARTSNSLPRDSSYIFLCMKAKYHSRSSKQ